jgi:hypothetical protein
VVCTAKEFATIVDLDEEYVARLCAMDYLETLPRKSRQHWRILTVPSLRKFGIEVLIAPPQGDTRSA